MLVGTTGILVYTVKLETFLFLSYFFIVKVIKGTAK
jgi:hypothetical protein